MIHIFISQGYQSEDRNPSRILGGEKFNVGVRSQNAWEVLWEQKAVRRDVP